ncbi:MAG: hypothetical protein RRB13_10105 [bacterium]|nr:hypothetical protein [bacterium]
MGRYLLTLLLIFWALPVWALSCRAVLQVDYELAVFEFYHQHRDLAVEGRSSAQLLNILTPFLQALSSYQKIEAQITKEYGDKPLEAILEETCPKEIHLTLTQERAEALRWVTGREPVIPHQFNRLRADITEKAQQLALEISKELSRRQEK